MGVMSGTNFASRSGWHRPFRSSEAARNKESAMLNKCQFSLGALMTLVVCSQIVADDVVIKSTSMPLTVLTEAKVHEALIAPETYYTDVPPAAPKAPRANLVEEKPAIPAELEKRAVWIPGYWEWKPDTESF